MSQSPFVTREIRFGTTLGSPLQLEDSLWVGLTDSYCKTPMAVTAENLAEKYKIPREEVDQFALRSQILWKKGIQYIQGVKFLLTPNVKNERVLFIQFYVKYED